MQAYNEGAPDPKNPYGMMVHLMRTPMHARRIPASYPMHARCIPRRTPRCSDHVYAAGTLAHAAHARILPFRPLLRSSLCLC